MLLAKNEFGQVHQNSLTQELPCLQIEHANVNAKVSLYGGQVLSWVPANEREVFWLSKESFYQKGKAIRGGIPLCWPWFGAHPEDNDKSASNHGFAREQLWHVEGIVIDEFGVEVCLTWQGKNKSDLWPNECQLKQILFFGRSFKQSLIMTNLGDNKAFYTGALHSYFSVSSPENINISALELACFDDKLTGKSYEPQALNNGVGPIDRIYHSNNEMTLIDNYWNRAINLKAFNTNQWVFWNPGAKVAANMPDIHINGEQEFVCLEAANTNMTVIPAKESVSISQEITISTLD